MLKAMMMVSLLRLDRARHGKLRIGNDVVGTFRSRMRLPLRFPFHDSIAGSLSAIPNRRAWFWQSG
jgi:hypothetical protein